MPNIIDEIYADATAKHKAENQAHACPVTGDEICHGLDVAGEAVLVAYGSTVPEDQFVSEVIASDFALENPLSVVAHRAIVLGLRKTLA